MTVDIIATPYRYGDLLEEASRLIDQHAPTVQAVGPRPQADGITITISTAAVKAAGSLNAVLDDLDCPFPLIAETGELIAIGLPAVNAPSTN